MRTKFGFIICFLLSSMAYCYSDLDQMVRVQVYEGTKPVIKRINFQTYLAGVIENEMPIKWPIEALKAQAVVARSYALVRMKENQHKAYDLDSTTKDQVYQPPKTSKSIFVVQETEKVVLKTFQGEILKAFYHSDCGGQTVPANQVWSGSYDSGTATDSWCAHRKSNQWVYKINKNNFLSELFQKPLQSMDLWAEYVKGRIQGIKVNDSNFSVQKLRQTFGFSNIRNSPKHIEHNPDEVIFSGQGYGHGAGLCQWGSFEQAQRGHDYIKILNHYYPKAHIILNAPARVASLK